MVSTDLYKERIEVSLDGRQIFYMFIGGAVLSCLVFVLGVMVGKRVESRSHLVATQSDARRDPLAALDRVAAKSEDLTFRQALRDQQQVAPAVDAEVTRLVQSAETATKPADVAAKPSVVVATAPAATPTPAVAASAAVAAAPVNTPSSAPVAVPTAAPAIAKPAVAAAPGKRYHTLRLSSFKQQSEAEAFMKQLRASGYSPFTMQATVDGEEWIRVCVGRHATYEDAIEAKKKYEAKLKKIAYVLTVGT